MRSLRSWLPRTSCSGALLTCVWPYAPCFSARPCPWPCAWSPGSRGGDRRRACSRRSPACLYRGSSGASSPESCSRALMRQGRLSPRRPCLRSVSRSRGTRARPRRAGSPRPRRRFRMARGRPCGSLAQSTSSLASGSRAWAASPQTPTTTGADRAGRAASRGASASCVSRTGAQGRGRSTRSWLCAGGSWGASGQRGARRGPSWRASSPRTGRSSRRRAPRTRSRPPGSRTSSRSRAATSWSWAQGSRRSCLPWEPAPACVRLGCSASAGPTSSSAPAPPRRCARG